MGDSKSAVSKPHTFDRVIDIALKLSIAPALYGRVIIIVIGDMRFFVADRVPSHAAVISATPI